MNINITTFWYMFNSYYQILNWGKKRQLAAILLFGQYVLPYYSKTKDRNLAYNTLVC